MITRKEIDKMIKEKRVNDIILAHEINQKEWRNLLEWRLGKIVEKLTHCQKEGAKEYVKTHFTKKNIAGLNEELTQQLKDIFFPPKSKHGWR